MSHAVGYVMKWETYLTSDLNGVTNIWSNLPRPIPPYKTIRIPTFAAI